MKPPAPLVPALSLAAALCALVVLERSGGTSEDGAWKAGAASVDITPEMPMWRPDFMGYLPSRRIWEEGGCEGGDSMTFSSATLYRTYHPNIWDPSVEERIVVKVHELRARLGREE